MCISVAQMMAIEERGHAMGFHRIHMMENAGAAVARRLAERFGCPPEGRVLVAAGGGNNGGDGMVAARHLAGRGARVSVALPGGAASVRTDEARRNLDLLGAMPSVEVSEGPGMGAAGAAVVVDAMLGTGISGPPRGPYARAISEVNASGAPVLAVDVPSGMDADTGEAAGEAVRADLTVTFHREKAGMRRGAALCGEVRVEPIGIPPEAEEGVL